MVYSDMELGRLIFHQRSHWIVPNLWQALGMVLFHCRMRTEPMKMLTQSHRSLQTVPMQGQSGCVAPSLDRHLPPVTLLPLPEVSGKSEMIEGNGAGHARVLEMRRAGGRKMRKLRKLMAPAHRQLLL